MWKVEILSSNEEVKRCWQGKPRKASTTSKPSSPSSILQTSSIELSVPLHPSLLHLFFYLIHLKLAQDSQEDRNRRLKKLALEPSREGGVKSRWPTLVSLGELHVSIQRGTRSYLEASRWAQWKEEVDRREIRGR